MGEGVLCAGKGDSTLTVAQNTARSPPYCSDLIVSVTAWQSKVKLSGVTSP